jgi:hypothetical protein
MRLTTRHDTSLAWASVLSAVTPGGSRGRAASRSRGLYNAKFRPLILGQDELAARPVILTSVYE